MPLLQYIIYQKVLGTDNFRLLDSNIGTASENCSFFAFVPCIGI